MLSKDFSNYVCRECFYRQRECICPKGPETMIQIDPGMQEPIRILNRKGWRTEYCCEGHFNPEAKRESMYVSFQGARNVPPFFPEGWKISNAASGGKSMHRFIALSDKFLEIREAYFHEEKNKHLAELIRWANDLPENEKMKRRPVNKSQEIRMKNISVEDDYICVDCAYPLSQCSCITAPDTLIYVPKKKQDIYRELNYKGWFTSSFDIDPFSEENTKAEIKIVFDGPFNAPTQFPSDWTVHDNRIITRDENSTTIKGLGNPSMVGEISYESDIEDRRLIYEKNKTKKLQELLEWAKSLPVNPDA